MVFARSLARTGLGMVLFVSMLSSAADESSKAQSAAVSSVIANASVATAATNVVETSPVVSSGRISPTNAPTPILAQPDTVRSNLLSTVTRAADVPQQASTSELHSNLPVPVVSAQSSTKDTNSEVSSLSGVSSKPLPSTSDPSSASQLPTKTTVSMSVLMHQLSNDLLLANSRLTNLLQAVTRQEERASAFAFYRDAILTPRVALWMTSIVLLSIVVWLLAQLWRTFRTGERPGVETYWGGLAGGVGGWRVTKSLVLLALIVFFTLVTVAMVIRVQPGIATAAQSGSEKTDAGNATTKPVNARAPAQ